MLLGFKDFASGSTRNYSLSLPSPDIEFNSVLSWGHFSSWKFCSKTRSWNAAYIMNGVFQWRLHWFSCGIREWGIYGGKCWRTPLKDWLTSGWAMSQNGNDSVWHVHLRGFKQNDTYFAHFDSVSLAPFMDDTYVFVFLIFYFHLSAHLGIIYINTHIHHFIRLSILLQRN